MDSLTNSNVNGGKMSFPFKLFQMLQDSEDKGFRHIVSWNPNGESFKVHDAAAFTKIIVPKYFKQTRYKSFQRQLCLYGFDRILSGDNKGSRYHPKFGRGEYHLISEIKYIGIKSKASQLNHKVTNDEANDGSRPKKQQANASTPSSASTDSGFRSIPQCMTISVVHETPSSVAYTCTSPLEKRNIPPTISPAVSERDFDHFVHGEPSSLSDFEDLDDLGFFEGMDFHSTDRMLGNEEKAHSLPKGAYTRLGPRQISVGRLSDFNSKEMLDAWQRGFEHALSVPQDSPWLFLSKNEAANL